MEEDITVGRVVVIVALELWLPLIEEGYLRYTSSKICCEKNPLINDLKLCDGRNPFFLLLFKKNVTAKSVC